MTHSRGKGIRKDREGTDLKYEMSQWAKKGLKVNKGRGRSKASHPASCPFTDPVRNPDLVLMAEHRGGTGDADKGERSGSDEETPGGATSNCGAVEAFHSMAEIASCSYEARKVIISTESIGRGHCTIRIQITVMLPATQMLRA